MSNPIPVNILSDDDEYQQATTPLPVKPKKRRTSNNSNSSSNPPTVFIIDDGPTPPKPPAITGASTPSFVADIPISESPKSCDPIFKQCTNFVSNPFGADGLICLESDNEADFIWGSPQNPNEPSVLEVAKDLEMELTCTNSKMSHERSCYPLTSEDDLAQVSSDTGDDMQPTSNNLKSKSKSRDNAKKKNAVKAPGRTRSAMEEKALLMNEKKQRKEQEKLQKQALKTQAAEMKKLQKEIQSWEKGKFSQQSIVAIIDNKVVEQGSIGGHLLTRLAEKGVKYQITSNPVERSIIWTMSVPENIAQALSRGADIPYLLLVYEAEEFCRLATNEALVDHVSRVQCLYPSHTICYVTNRLAAYMNKREQEHYKNPSNHSCSRPPPMEELLSNITSRFVGVHSRLCADDAELAEHVVGLTTSLASCQYRKKLTRLSVNANGSLIPKDCAYRALVKKSSWLKALVAIPKVQPRFAVAIWKKYPTMKCLLSAYMDPNKSVHEKEFLLEDLTTEGSVGENRRVGEMCSKRVYRILMAECGTIRTDDVENGADFFHVQAS